MLSVRFSCYFFPKLLQVFFITFSVFSFQLLRNAQMGFSHFIPKLSAKSFEDMDVCASQYIFLGKSAIAFTVFYMEVKITNSPKKKRLNVTALRSII